MQLLNELVELAKKATPGEWIRESGEGWQAICSGNDQDNEGFIIASFQGKDEEANREFVEKANPAAILAIAEYVNGLEAKLSNHIPDAKWVKCSERMPEIGDEVLIRIPVVDKFNIENGMYKGDGKFVGAWCATRGKGCTYDVTHWQPLPEAPDDK